MYEGEAGSGYGYNGSVRQPAATTSSLANAESHFDDDDPGRDGYTAQPAVAVSTAHARQHVDQATYTNMAMFLQRFQRQIATRVLGMSPLVELSLICLFAELHFLLEGFYGTGKTLVAKSIAQSLGLRMARIQGTADLLPADITGGDMYVTPDRGHGEGDGGLPPAGVLGGEWQFVEGPIFDGEFVLCDELNRIGERSLSGLIQAMEEGEVTSGRRTYRLRLVRLFMATQNPLDVAGTAPLLQNLRDRFGASYAPPMPDMQQLVTILADPWPKPPLASALGRDPDESVQIILRWRAAVADVTYDPSIRQYIAEIVDACWAHVRTAGNNNGELQAGPSPRAAVQWLRACQARAALYGRAFVRPSDVKHLAIPMLAHRLIEADYDMGREQMEALIATIVEHEVPPPSEQPGARQAAL